MDDSALDIDAVILDMDGLMFDTERIRLDAWQMVARQEGYEIPEALLIDCIGRTTADSEQLLNAALAGTGFDYRRARVIRGTYIEKMVAEGGIPVKAGLGEILDAVDSLGLAKAVATSTLRAEAIEMLTDTGLIDRFGAIACGNEVENGKPAPDIFLMTAERLGIDPRRCVVLEDSENGVRAAAAAGCTPIVIPDIKPPTDEVLALAHRRFDSLIDAAQYLLASVPTR
jgi:HAD superfamily hydrolase (TIGR01509 family)